MNTSTKTIEITVDSEGSVSVKTKGFTGSTYKDASRFIEQALGRSSHETQLPEYFQKTHASNQIQQGN